MAKRKHSDEHSDPPTETTEPVHGPTHESWFEAETLSPMTHGRCRCTSIEHALGEPGCWAAPG